jgi:hypothetical protein
LRTAAAVPVIASRGVMPVTGGGKVLPGAGPGPTSGFWVLAASTSEILIVARLEPAATGKPAVFASAASMPTQSLSAGTAKRSSAIAASSAELNPDPGGFVESASAIGWRAIPSRR